MDIIKPLTFLNRKARRIVESSFHKKDDVSTPKNAFLGFAFAKAYKTHGSVLALCALGSGQDAAILARSIFELLVVTRYILADESNSRIRRWLDYEWIIKRKWLTYAESDPSVSELLAQQVKSHRRASANIRRRAAKVQETHRFNTRFGWSDKSIAGMASEVGLEKPYRTYYDLTSALHHSSVAVVSDYIKKKSGEFYADTHGSAEWVQDALFGALNFFLMIAAEWDKRFQHSVADQLQVCYDQMDVLAAQINAHNDSTTA